MYRVEWRRPGCLALIIFALLGLIPATFVVSMVDALTPGRLGEGPQFLTWAAAYICIILGMANLYKRLTTRRVPICLHCGVATDPTFRICRSCGRVK